MHKVSIPDDIVARARLQRGGREHLFETLDMAKVAHIIVDLQVGFVAKAFYLYLAGFYNAFADIFTWFGQSI